jgi:hypothetical protein
VRQGKVTRAMALGDRPANEIRASHPLPVAPIACSGSASAIGGAHPAGDPALGVPSPRSTCGPVRGRGPLGRRWRLIAHIRHATIIGRCDRGDGLARRECARPRSRRRRHAPASASPISSIARHAPLMSSPQENSGPQQGTKRSVVRPSRIRSLAFNSTGTRTGCLPRRTRFALPPC